LNSNSNTFANLSANKEVFDDYLDQYPIIAKSYIKDYIQNQNIIDEKHGPKYNDLTSKWLLGVSTIDFHKDSGNIIVDGEEFNGTPGLYNLLFLKDPDIYNKEDISNYKIILEKSNVYRIGHTSEGRLKGNAGSKYIEIVKPLLYTPQRENKKRGGGGTFKRSNKMVYNKKNVEYVYWDDVNELVDRLKLLFASKEAGNTSHDNEILSIIEELQEANVIQ